jgi:hypothetical protein
MKKFLIAAAAILGFGAGGAQAQQSITIGATVLGFCTVGTVTNATPSFSAPGGVVSLTPTNHTIPVTCNGASTVTVTSQNGGLTGPAFVSGFDNIINYTVSTTGYVSTSGSTLTLPTAVGLETLASVGGGASVTPLAVTLTPLPNVGPVLAGGYSDVVTVTIVAL